MPKISISVQGLDELFKTLEEFGSEVAGKHVAPSLRKGALIVHKAAVNNAPESGPATPTKMYDSSGKVIGHTIPGRLKNAIKIRKHPRPRMKGEIYGVGVDLGSSRADNKGAWYGSIVEFKGGKGGRGKGYLRRALEDNRDSATHLFAAELSRRIGKLAKSLGNKNATKVAAAVRSQATAQLALKKGKV